MRVEDVSPRGGRAVAWHLVVRAIAVALAVVVVLSLTESVLAASSSPAPDILIYFHGCTHHTKKLYIDVRRDGRYQIGKTIYSARSLDKKLGRLTMSKYQVAVFVRGDTAVTRQSMKRLGRILKRHGVRIFIR